MAHWNVILTGVVLLLIAGFSGADSISSSIMVNGASWVSSSVISQGQTYAESLFTTDIANLMRDLNTRSDGRIETMTNVRSSGPLGLSEYSHQGTNSSKDHGLCLFSLQTNHTAGENEIEYIGLLQTGQYGSTRTLDHTKSAALSTVNGSGMVLVRAYSDDGTNETVHTSDIAGEMNMTDRIELGVVRWI